MFLTTTIKLTCGTVVRTLALEVYYYISKREHSGQSHHTTIDIRRRTSPTGNTGQATPNSSDVLPEYANNTTLQISSSTSSVPVEDGRSHQNTRSEVHHAGSHDIELGGWGNARLKQDIRYRAAPSEPTPLASPDPASTTPEAQDGAFNSHVLEQSPLRRLERKLNEMSREEVPAATELDTNLVSSGPVVEIPEQT